MKWWILEVQQNLRLRVKGTISRVRLFQFLLNKKSTLYSGRVRGSLDKNLDLAYSDVGHRPEVCLYLSSLLENRDLHARPQGATLPCGCNLVIYTCFLQTQNQGSCDFVDIIHAVWFHRLEITHSKLEMHSKHSKLIRDTVPQTGGCH